MERRGYRRGGGGYQGGDRGDRPYRPFGRAFATLPKPVKEGDVVDLTIEAVGSKGDGIAKVKGFIVFVPNTKTGDKVKVKIVSVRPNFALGQIAEPGEEAAAAPVEAAPSEETVEEVETEEEV
jgi:predicted RNA-binding protein with TRAM domain